MMPRRQVPWNKGKYTGPRSKKTRKKIGDAQRGHITSEETKAKIAKSTSGERSSQWKGGISRTPGLSNNRKKRFRKEHGEFCMLCGKTREEIEKERGMPYKYAFPIHHIDENTKNNDDSNLMIVCHRCNLVYLHPEKFERIRDETTGRWL